jgi:DNA (cytosine-5)-methyltransferase 1
MAGFEIRAASEFVEAARDTYRLNHDGVPISPADIREINGKHLLALAGLDEVDLLEGSPPCAAFSTSGKREDGWGNVSNYSDTAQRSDDLFFEFARILNDIQPKVFVAENVKGLTVGTAIGYFKEILRRLRSCGYRVEARIVDASRCGVPQKRESLIFVGVREDLGLAPVFPAPLPTRPTVRDALGEYLSIPAHVGRFDPETGEDLDFTRYAIGREYKNLRLGVVSRKYLNLVRVSPVKPCLTITATAGVVGAASVTHPFEPRKFNLRELRALCSFPADFELTGTYRERAERIGRSVPPLMMKRVGETIRDEILRRLP